MRVTDIAPDNAEYFESLAPEGALADDNLIWLGAVAGDGTACAVLGVGVYEESAYIDWIYTDPSFRRKGAARELLRWLRTFLRKAEMEILEISFSGENEGLEEFLEAEGFFFDDDLNTYSVPFKDLIYSELIDTALEKNRTDCRVVTFKNFGRYDELYEYLLKDGISLGFNVAEMDLSLIRGSSAPLVDAKPLNLQCF